MNAEEVVKRLTGADSGRELRQLGVVDRNGKYVVFSAVIVPPSPSVSLLSRLSSPPLPFRFSPYSPAFSPPGLRLTRADSGRKLRQLRVVDRNGKYVRPSVEAHAPASSPISPSNRISDPFPFSVSY